MKNWKTVLPVMALALLVAPEALAEGGNEYLSGVGIGTGIAIGFAALGGGIGQGLAAKGALEGIARNPQASGKITTPMFAGLAFVESLVIFSFLIAFTLAGKIPDVG